MPLNPTRRARIIRVAIASAVGAVMYAGAAHADEGVTWCAPHEAPVVLAKRPAAAISYAPHHSSIHRHRVPAMLRKPAPELGCTPESVAAAMPPLSVPAVPAVPAAAGATDPVAAGAIPSAYAETPPAAGAAVPVAAEAIPPVSVETPPAAEAAAPVAAAAIPPASMVTPDGAVAAAAAGALPVAAIPIGMLATYIGVCLIGHACGGDSGTVGGHSVSTTGTTGTY